jgi:hypothetical protein
MAWTKTKTAAVVGVSLLVVGAITIGVIKTVERLRPKDRLTALRLLVWPNESKLEAQRIKQRQAVDETSSATTIDLRPHINTKLTEASLCWKGNDDDNLAELPPGKHIYAGVPFDVAGSVQLMGGWMKHYGKTYPAQVGDIQIGRKCTKLHLLHGNGFITQTNFDTVVSKLILHYADASTHEINLVAGEQAFDWWSPLFKTGLPQRFSEPAPGTERAWTGSNAYIRKWQPDLSLVLYRTTLDNPQPDVAVASVDFASTQTITCPFLVGLTVE